MAEAARAGAEPLLPGLPDEIVVWEILVLLDPKSLFRCRAVGRAWRCAASTRRFLLAHHARQPTLPLVYGFNIFGDGGKSLDIIAFDHRAADQLQPVARFDSSIFFIEASCDGLLVLSLSFEGRSFAICNPATRQYAPLPTLSAFLVLGMYPHSPTGEYRLLLYRTQGLRLETMVTDCQDGSYVFTLGSGQPPRLIGWPDVELLTCSLGPVLLRGNLHWHRMKHKESESNAIIVFYTTAESFRKMRAPIILGGGNLFEMDGMLGILSLTDADTVIAIDIWMLQDYETEVWALKYRVLLWPPDNGFHNYWNAVAVPLDGDVFVLLKFDDQLVEVDIDGKVEADFIHRGLNPTPHRLKQTLVPHTFFPTLEGYAVNASPFI